MRLLNRSNRLTKEFVKRCFIKNTPSFKVRYFLTEYLIKGVGYGHR